VSTLGLGLSRDLVISREYWLAGWLARQRYAAVTRPVGMDAGQRTQPFRGAYASGGIPVSRVNSSTWVLLTF
jgi:hypothetical protein